MKLPLPPGPIALAAAVVGIVWAVWLHEQAARLALLLEETPRDAYDAAIQVARIVNADWLLDHDSVPPSEAR